MSMIRSLQIFLLLSNEKMDDAVIRKTFSLHGYLFLLYLDLATNIYEEMKNIQIILYYERLQSTVSIATKL